MSIEKLPIKIEFDNTLREKVLKRVEAILKARKLAHSLDGTVEFNFSDGEFETGEKKQTEIEKYMDAMSYIDYSGIQYKIFGFGLEISRLKSEKLETRILALLERDVYFDNVSELSGDVDLILNANYEDDVFEIAADLTRDTELTDSANYSPFAKLVGNENEEVKSAKIYYPVVYYGEYPEIVKNMS
ncbi:hypothetical protein GX888_02575 [Candidatus Dojkabacteria bacterium]|uniref:Uncharacterized protein n=1 Tax=Candidatus Dojkabacteria bacterium TaxID=2099670 RepID=A0A847VDQ6_9BACT|nr:hypothetical protein [Candidatus Dojkabacteria bacterium]